MNNIYEIVPSDEALALINARLPKAKRYLAIARTGNHHLNPYHNLIHELGSVYWAYSCFVNSEVHGDDVMTISEQEFLVPKLIMAALFHDHNHSGGRESDKVNVTRAIEFLLTKFGHQNLIDHFGARWSEIRGAIDSTLFIDGEFPVEPKTFLSKCLRDADLMSIYSNEGRNLLVGLLDELGTPVHSAEDVDKAVAMTSQFLKGATMYTTFGQYMKTHYLDQSLDLFKHRLLGGLHLGDTGKWPLVMTNGK